MAANYEGYVNNTPVARGIRHSTGRSIAGSMLSNKKSTAAATKAREAEAYQKGILNTLYAWEVQGLPIPGFDK